MDVTLEITFTVNSEDEKRQLLADYFNGTLSNRIQGMYAPSDSKNPNEYLQEILTLLKNGGAIGQFSEQPQEIPSSTIEQTNHSTNAKRSTTTRKTSAGGMFSKKSIMRG